MGECNSTVLLRHELIDCRMLQLELEFYELNQSQIKVVANHVFFKIIEMLKEIFFVSWTWKNRRMQENGVRKRINDLVGYVDFGFEGDVFSNMVFDEKTFKQYDSQLLHDASVSRKETLVPVDYLDKYYELFGNALTSEQCKEALLEMFNSSGRRKIAKWRNHDVSGLFSSCPYVNRQDLYYGGFVLKINLTCLGSEISCFAEKMIELARGIADITSQTSARIALSPMNWSSPCSGHMMYFGDGIIKDTTHRKNGFLDIEWNRFNYVRGAEWWNLISPLQRKHLPLLSKELQFYENIAVEELPGGGVIVCSKRNILQTDIPELMDIKKLLYDALYPGKAIILREHLEDPDLFGFRVKPRQQWEYVPMLEDEIIVMSDRVVFQHKHALK